jgi:SAM-dependent methyltransferase
MRPANLRFKPALMGPTHWPWPLPALVGWALSWLVWMLLHREGAPPVACLLLAAATGAAVSLACEGLARRLWVAVGFPLSAWVLGAAAAWPAWAWLLLLLPLLLAYPLRAWRDAPFFPTPARALHGLEGVVGQPARVLDAGCGLGHGLQALRALWPQAELHGVEWSPLLVAATRRRCRWACITRGDLWAQDWRGFDLVYAFQRPESMARLWAKALAELPAGHWLVSLEFAVPDVAPHACLRAPGQRPVWVYRVPRRPVGSTPSSTPSSTASDSGR